MKQQRAEVITSLSELKEYMNDLKDGQVLSVDLRGNGYKEFEEDCIYYNGQKIPLKDEPIPDDVGVPYGKKK